MDIFKKFENGSEINLNGYLKGKLLNSGDLNFFRTILANHVSRIMKETISFKNLIELKNNDLEDIIKNKTLRIFSNNDANLLLSTNSLKKLLNSRKNLTICNATDPLKGLTNLPEVYFRIVKPNTGGNPELGHIDWWYDELYNIDQEIRPTYKIWISLKTEPKKNGLLLKKFDNSDVFKYYINNTDFGPRPKLINPLNMINYDFPSIKSGEAIIFDSKKTLHMGAKNCGLNSRISIEISLREKND